MIVKKYDEDVSLLENKKINGKYFKLAFHSPKLSRNIKPGQFLHVRVNQGQDPYLRRPFSYFRVSPGRAEILYEVLGYGTAILSKKKKGDVLRVMGPLGNAFTENLGKKKRILVAGGVGVPPLIFLAEKYPTEYLLIGTKSKIELMPKSELRKIRAKILCSTEDGSYGTEGRVTLLLEKILMNQHPGEFFIQTCGPKKMMKVVATIAAKYGVKGEASWDESMACGVGACLGCMVRTRSGLKRACADGPVFKFEDLEL
ncbi:MAG: dihydroorotate dehydrogenase electron transfer subunit [Candidatus Omnitrophota bacterium]